MLIEAFDAPKSFLSILITSSLLIASYRIIVPFFSLRRRS
jgi:hypothetical protein